MLEDAGLRISLISSIIENYPKITVDARATVEEFGLPMLPSYRQLRSSDPISDVVLSNVNSKRSRRWNAKDNISRAEMTKYGSAQTAVGASPMIWYRLH